MSELDRILNNIWLAGYNHKSLNDLSIKETYVNSAKLAFRDLLLERLIFSTEAQKVIIELFNKQRMESTGNKVF